MHLYDVPLELKIYIFAGFAVAALALFGFVWYGNRKAGRKDKSDPKHTKRTTKRNRHDDAR